MIPDDVDALFDGARLPVNLSAERVTRIAGRVLEKLDQAPPQAWWLGWRDWILIGTPTVSWGRFAAALTVAALLGLAVGSQGADVNTATQSDGLFALPTLFPLES
jgi:hypothetical protein